MNQSHIDNLLGSTMGVSDDSIKNTGVLQNFYRDAAICADCYKVYRNLDKRRSKIRQAARSKKRIHPKNVVGDVAADVKLSGQLHGRDLKEEEVWEALGYGRVERTADAEVVKKQRTHTKEMSKVPKWRDLREIKANKMKELERLEKRKQIAMGLDTDTMKGPPVDESLVDQEGNKLTGVKRLIKRIEKRAKLNENQDALVGKSDMKFVENIGKKVRRRCGAVRLHGQAPSPIQSAH